MQGEGMMDKHEHRTGLEHETGYGFGLLDYYCWDCGKLVRSVPIDEMNDEEKNFVGWLAGRVVRLT